MIYLEGLSVLHITHLEEVSDETRTWHDVERRW